MDSIMNRVTDNMNRDMNRVMDDMNRDMDNLFYFRNKNSKGQKGNFSSQQNFDTSKGTGENERKDSDQGSDKEKKQRRARKPESKSESKTSSIKPDGRSVPFTQLGKECSVCKEIFEEGETAVEFPLGNFFHCACKHL